MNLQILSLFCLCFLSAIVSLRAQAECDMIEASDLGSSTPSTDGIIALLLGGLDAARRPTVSVSNVEVISLAVGTVQNMFRWASVFATYNCSGMLCPTVPYPTTEQFEAQCVEPTPGNPIWTDPNLLVEDRSTPINPNLTSLDLRKDCSFCLNPDDRGNLGVPAAIEIDPEFHCAACDSSCLTGNDGLGYCTGVTAENCCNVYQPNAEMGVNICAVSCDMGYEADPPDFICERRCPVLDNPDNGQVSHPTRTVDSVATYTCDRRFELTGGDEMRTCQNDSIWNGTAAVCSEIDCGTLNNPSNGQVALTVTTADSRAIYTCITGYLINGNTVRLCLLSGRWTGSDPTCEIADCGNLTAPDNGTISFTTTTFNSVAVYTCMEGLIHVGTLMRTCQQNGVWSGNEPICEVTTLVGSPRPTEGPDGGGLEGVEIAFIIIGVIFFVIMIVLIVLLVAYAYYKWTHDDY